MLNGSGVAGAAGRLSAALSDAGYAVLPAGNAPSRFSSSTVYYVASEHRDEAELVAEVVAESVEAVGDEGVAVAGLPVSAEIPAGAANVVVLIGADELGRGLRVSESAFVATPVPADFSLSEYFIGVMQASGIPGAANSAISALLDAGFVAEVNSDIAFRYKSSAVYFYQVTDGDAKTNSNYRILARITAETMGEAAGLGKAIPIVDVTRTLHLQQGAISELFDARFYPSSVSPHVGIIVGSDELARALQAEERNSGLRRTPDYDTRLPLAASVPRDRFVPGLLDVQIFTQANDQGSDDMKGILNALSGWFNIAGRYQWAGSNQLFADRVTECPAEGYYEYKVYGEAYFAPVIEYANGVDKWLPVKRTPDGEIILHREISLVTREGGILFVEIESDIDRVIEMIDIERYTGIALEKYPWLNDEIDLEEYTWEYAPIDSERDTEIDGLIDGVKDGTYWWTALHASPVDDEISVGSIVEGRTVKFSAITPVVGTRQVPCSVHDYEYLQTQVWPNIERSLEWLGFTPQNVCGAPAGYSFTDLIKPTREFDPETQNYTGDAIFTTERLLELHGGERINPEANLDFYIREAVQAAYDALRIPELLDETETMQLILCEALISTEGEIPEIANSLYRSGFIPGVQPRESLLSQGTYHLKDMSRNGNLAYVVVCHPTLGERHILLHWREAGYRAELLGAQTNIGCQAGYESQPHFSSEPNTFAFPFGEQVFTASDLSEFPRVQ